MREGHRSPTKVLAGIDPPSPAIGRAVAASPRHELAATIQNSIGVHPVRGGCSDLEPQAIADRAAEETSPDHDHVVERTEEVRQQSPKRWERLMMLPPPLASLQKLARTPLANVPFRARERNDPLLANIDLHYALDLGPWEFL
jgi:hypothetical protein